MPAYYNEIDEYVAEWLRNLIAAGHIAPGDVDTRSIEDVHPDDLRPYTQCHFFAGIGVWSYALRGAGWPDDRSIWTGSCPCQPFSAAGKGAAFDDERHLWPAWHWLIRERRPPIVVGEQVASAAVAPWIDLVHADMESADYAFGAVAFPSASVGAPHIRDRLYWVAHPAREWSGRVDRELGGSQADGVRAVSRQRPRVSEPGYRSAVGRLDDANNAGLERHARDDGATRGQGPGRPVAATSVSGGLAHPNGRNASAEREQRSGQQRQQPEDGSAVRVADTTGAGRGERRTNAPGRGERSQPQGLEQRSGDMRFLGRSEPAGPVNGFWRAADWLLCRDGKWRPVEPGYEQMADGSARSLGRVCSAAAEEIQEEVDDWAIRHQADIGEGLRALWRELQSQALCEREVGRFSGVQSPAVLLAFLRQLTEQGWRFSDALARESAGTSQIVVRVLRHDPGAACTPLRRELAEQLAGQPADPLQELSSILAHHAAQCWGEACRAKAGAASFPLAHNAPSRVGRLRAYGNAINAEAARTWIETVMECMP